MERDIGTLSLKDIFETAEEGGIPSGILAQEEGQSHILKLYKAQKKSSLLQRLTSAVNRIVSYSEVRQILIESLAF